MFRRSTLLFLVATVALSGVRAEEPALESDDDKTLYALGLLMSRSLSGAGLTEADLSLVQAGLADGILGRKPRVALDVYGPKIDAFMQARMKASAGNRREAGLKFLESQAAEEGAVKTASGLVYRQITPGTGAKPAPTDTVRIHYHGTLPDGTVFDSSVERNAPASFNLGQVIPCFSEGVGMIAVGGKSRIVCPPDLAYGDRGSPPSVPPGATLVFEVELLEIVPPDPPAGP